MCSRVVSSPRAGPLPCSARGPTSCRQDRAPSQAESIRPRARQGTSREAQDPPIPQSRRGLRGLVGPHTCRYLRNRRRTAPARESPYRPADRVTFALVVDQTRAGAIRADRRTPPVRQTGNGGPVRPPAPSPVRPRREPRGTAEALGRLYGPPGDCRQSPSDHPTRPAIGPDRHDPPASNALLETVGPPDRPGGRLIQHPRPADRCRPDSLDTAIGAGFSFHTSPTRLVGS